MNFLEKEVKKLA